MVCKHCRETLADGAKFCENCGNKVEEAVTASESFKEPERVEAEVVSEGTSTSSYSETESTTAREPEYSASAELEEKGPQGYSIASMVCGILGLLCCCCGWFGLILSIAGIVLGIISLKKNCEGRGMAIAGIVCGGIGACFTLIGIIIGLASGSIMPDLNDITDLDNLGDFLDSL